MDPDNHAQPCCLNLYEEEEEEDVSVVRLAVIIETSLFMLIGS